MIYLDNAAPSFPKPAGVSDSMKQYLDCVGAPLNRSVYGRAQAAGLDAPDGRAIFEAAAAGDARTLAVLNGWINEIAQGLAGLVHIFNPQLILIGGGVSAQQALLIDPLAAQVRKSIMPAFAEGLEVRAAALQNDAGLVGAVYYFKQQRD